MTNELVKFTAIVICFVIAATGRDTVSRRDYVLVTAALAATVTADFFLVIINDDIIGVAFFCIVQVLYNMRFGGTARLKVLPFALAAPAVFFAVTGNILVAVALVYAQLFVLSYAAMLAALRKRAFSATGSILIFIGMTAFMLCDICVAIWNLSLWGVIENAYGANLAYAAIWLFYTPGQVCLALSSRRFSPVGRGSIPAAAKE
ncbi:MAG: lysoplasmalogenase family protein [Clostridiales bacterium]|jgi:hypothetical protein|nr:lysoplasmalogenase family protein [Clostridiales bacterium]